MDEMKYSQDARRRAELRAAMDIGIMRQTLGKIFCPGEKQELELRIARAFPWANTGGGIVEYEMKIVDREKKSSRKRTLYAELGPTSGRDGNRTNGAKPMTREELDLFFSGGRTISISQPEMALSTFPFDHRMPWLGSLTDPERVERLLEDELSPMFGGRHIAVMERPEILGYRFGKRCTLLYRLGAPEGAGIPPLELNVIGKTHHDDRGRSVFESLRKLWDWSTSGGVARTPVISRPLCYLPHYRTYFQEVTKGFQLSRIKVRELRQDLLPRIAELLAAFHASGVAVDASYSPHDELSLLEKVCAYLPVLRPDLGARARVLLTSLERWGEEIRIHEYQPHITHRDFYDKQIIVGTDGMYLIDLDTVAMSDQALDVGNFLAHISLRALQHGETGEEMAHDAHLFTSAYSAHNPHVERVRIVFYCAAALLRLACLYAYRPTWRRVVVRLLDECEALVGRIPERQAGSVVKE